MTDTLFDMPISLRPVFLDPKRTKHVHVLNLGAGVQSTSLQLMAGEGRILDEYGKPVKFECSIFADTQEEPIDTGENVYTHLSWLEKNSKIRIIKWTAGKLGEDLKNGTNSTANPTKCGRFASIPAFTLNPDGTVGKTKRQCTSEYKIKVIEKCIRRDVFGLKPRARMPKNVLVIQHVGISIDEIGRMLKMRSRQRESGAPWQHFRFPLVEMGLTRGDCREYLKNRVPYRVPRSACVFCPFHDNEEWQRIKNRGGQDWARVVEIDRALRTPGMRINKDPNAKLFLHKTCKPIDEIDFGTAPSERHMAGECEGMCGH